MKFAKVVFWTAGIWGVLVLTPLFFIFDMIGRTDPPPITHPGFYYGFRSGRPNVSDRLRTHRHRSCSFPAHDDSLGDREVQLCRGDARDVPPAARAGE